MISVRPYQITEIGSKGAGILGILEESDIPFPPKRIYWLRNVDSSEIRGKHAHIKLEQLLVPIAGTLTVKIHDGVDMCEISLSAGKQSLYLKPGLWRELSDFSDDAVLLVVASERFEESDYIRDWDKFLDWKREI